MRQQKSTGRPPSARSKPDEARVRSVAVAVLKCMPAVNDVREGNGRAYLSCILFDCTILGVRRTNLQSGRGYSPDT